MRRRNLLFSAGGGADGSTATPLSIVLAEKSSGNLIIVEGSKWDKNTYSSTSYTPVGIVVIPGEHGVLKSGDGTTNQCGVMSIVPMSYSTPETGGTSEQSMCWGGYGAGISGKSDGLGRTDSVINGLVNYNTVVNVTNSATGQKTPTGSSSYAYIPRQGSAGATPTWSSSNYAPSPYAGSDMKSGEFNTAYSDTTKSSYNALSDFKGIVNTKILTDLATAQSNWKTDSKITNNSNAGYYPAACCCARFHTTGTKAFKDCTTEELKKGTGFWYLPSCGELGYIIPRLYDINATISKLYEAYTVGVQLDTSSYYWSSSEYSVSLARFVNTGNGGVNLNYKSDNFYVRAFLRL